MQDSIEREIKVKASQEVVYKAITDPNEITKWFPDKVEGTLNSGDSPVFTFDGHAQIRIHVIEARPNEYFSYRWVPGGSGTTEDKIDDPNTLVEFFIEAAGSETKVTLKESGFASLPNDLMEEGFKQNTMGWEFMFGRLEDQLKNS
jgi:uncharacterized protein YndB with AHSA1/START domain